MDESDILNLTPETSDKTEFCLCATVFLTLVVDILGNLLLKDLGRLRVLQDLVLAEG